MISACFVRPERSDGMPTTKVPRTSSPPASRPPARPHFGQGDRGRNFLRLRRKRRQSALRLLGWVVAARWATAGRTPRAYAKLRANSAFGSMSFLTQLVVGSPKNHIGPGESNFFIANWPCCLMLFGQAALFRKRDVNFPEEGAERSRTPKGHPPIRAGSLTGARQRRAGPPARRAVRVLRVQRQCA